MMLHFRSREGIDDFAMAPYNHAPRSGLLDRCPLGVDELPLPVLPNEDARPAALLIYRAILVLSFGGGTIAHDGVSP